jgi:hypothetical protein
MSVDLCVFLHDHRLPSCDEWQAAIDAEGRDLKLDDFSPREQTGFVPCMLNVKDCGFEYFFAPVESGEANEVLEKIGDRDRVVTLSFHSSELDMRAATIAAAALTTLSDGVYFDGENFAVGKTVYALLELQESNNQQRLRQSAETMGTYNQAPVSTVRRTMPGVPRPLLGLQV